MDNSQPIKSYRDLRVWKRGMNLAKLVYVATRKWPREELFTLTAQVRRSAGSVPANIAEGYGRQTRPSYLNHLRIAQGSLKETETHLLLAVEVGICEASAVADALSEADDLGRMLRGLIQRLSVA